MAKVSLRAYNREIETMIDRGQLDEAIAHCRHILKTYPKHLETYRLLGKAYLEYKRYGDAADIFSRILVAVPNDFVSQVGMSIIRDEENRLDDAIWHMERAFETQPSNPAIQSELQRLYARRDGVRPPRIRMTRGALAHMYVQGDLYPQAISEIKSVLQEDESRADMQALLARACYKSGLKNEAADVATALLRRYPYSFDANRVMVEILEADHSESTQLYTQRVYELDPYAAHVTGTVFQSAEVSDAAVNIERLDWNGQPVTMQPDWRESKAISLESGMVEEQQPDWLNRSPEETSGRDDSGLSPSQPTPAPIFESTPPFEQPPAQSDDIPDFMRAAGWGKSTSEVDESQPAFTEDETGSGQGIEAGDLPDWVKAMRPAEAESPAPSQEQEEELPDWINNIGSGALASQSDDQLDWLGQTAQQPSETPATGEGEQADWVNRQESEPATSSEGEPDWMKDFAKPESAPAPEESDDLDWIKNLGETGVVASSEEADDLEWIKNLGSQSQADQPDWLKASSEPEQEQSELLKGFASESDSLLNLGEDKEQEQAEEDEVSAPTTSADDFDFLTQSSEEPVSELPADTLSSNTDRDRLGVSDQERDDSFAWLESLAAKQGATEGLLTQPEDRREEEPEWVKQVRGTKEETSESQPAAHEQPPASMDDLGKSEDDRDDAFAWLENLAARQGASEGLLTKPEERREEEPEWVKRAKDLSAQEQPASSEETISEQPTAIAEPEQEQPKAEEEVQAEQPVIDDDVEGWLRNLEGREQPGETTAQAEAAGPEMEQPITEENAQPEQPAAEDEVDTWLRDLQRQEQSTESTIESEVAETELEQPVVPDETEVWLGTLGEEKPAESGADQTAIWLKNLDEKEAETEQPVEPTETELPAWIDNIEEETPPAEPVVLESETNLESTWLPPAEAEEPAPVEEAKSEEDTLPSWLSELDQEEEKISTPSEDEDLPAWLRSEETAPAASERSLASDWRPSEERLEEPVSEPTTPVEAEESEPALAPEMSIAREEPVEEIQPEQPEPELEPEPSPVMESPPPAPEPEGQAISSTDPVLETARNELSSNDITGALISYEKLIKKARYLDEVIYDLREALYRYPVSVDIWQALGDAYMRSNRLQDALDAYTKAEELLR